MILMATKTRCRVCGQHTLDYTAGLCPRVGCRKHMLYGPCAGVDHGKCEVDSSMDCIWVVIYNKLRGQGKLDHLVRLK